MNTNNSHRLNMIKQKYGYLPKNENHNRHQTYSITQKQNNTQRHQPIHTYIPKINTTQILNTQYQDKLSRIAISRPKQIKNQSPYHRINQDTYSNKLEADSPFSLAAHSRVFKQLPNEQNHSQLISSTAKDKNQSYVTSYQKTYDLLQNYRKRIRSHYEQQKQLTHTQQTIKQAQMTTSKISQNKMQQTISGSIYNAKQDKTISYKPVQTQNKNDFKSTGQTRCSPLIGFQPNSTNLEQQMSNIQKIQQKIHSVLGVRNCR